MANLKPFQVIVTFKDGSKKEYGFNTAMARRIYLWGVHDAAGKEILNIDGHEYKMPCMVCNSRPVERTFVRDKRPGEKTTRIVVKICERCSGNFLAIAGWEQFSVGGGGTPGQIVSNDEAFGLPSFEDHKKKLFKDKTGLDDPEDARPIG